MIGVAISTLNRRDMALDTVEQWRKRMPPESVLVVVDDASDVPFPSIGVNLVRNSYRRGVAGTKNKGIEFLMQAGCDHIFLADDDTFPLVDNWWEPYVNSPEPHLAYQWVKPGSGHKWTLQHNDGEHFSIGFPRGVMLYATRQVIETVGGMDTAHGAWGGEHVEWSQRIHDHSLTTWPFADVCGSDKIWYAHDRARGNTTGSTFPLTERRRMAAAAGLQWGRGRSFIPYREGEGMQDYDLGPGIDMSEHYAVLRHTVGITPPGGVAVEFGVGRGESTRIIASRMPVFGFGSTLGLPEDWRDDPDGKFEKGSFAYALPSIRNAKLIDGLFEDTLPDFDFGSIGHINLVHFDADLRSATETALDHIGSYLKPGTFCVFDEWHGYESAAQHEQAAFKEFAYRTGITWTVVGHGHQAWAIRIT